MLRAQANVYFDNVPPNARISGEGWGGMKINNFRPDPLQSMYNGPRMALQ
jgi:hypothetical protein